MLSDLKGISCASDLRTEGVVDVLIDTQAGTGVSVGVLTDMNTVALTALMTDVGFVIPAPFIEEATVFAREAFSSCSKAVFDD